MNTDTNSAIRLSGIVSSIYNDDSKRIVDVWKNIFKISEQDNNSLEKAIIECLYALNEEFDLIINGMKKTDFSEKLYINEINSLKRILIVPTGINGDWAGRKANIKPVDIKVLEFCSEILPIDEEIDKKEIEELKEMLLKLEKFLNENNLNEELKKILTLHLRKMKMALYKYDIQGVDVFDEVLQSAYGEVMKNPSFFSDSNELKNNLSLLWGKAQKIYTFSTKTHDAYINFNNMAGTVNKLISPIIDSN